MANCNCKSCLEDCAPKCIHHRYDCLGVEDVSMGADDFRCNKCWKDLRNAKLKIGKSVPFYVVVTEISRHFGGREEGDWYYDWTSFKEKIKVSSFKEALNTMKEMKNQYPAPRYNRFSVLGDADIFVNMYYDLSQLPEETKCKPRYE